jgi:hypothetical protein
LLQTGDRLTIVCKQGEEGELASLLMPVKEGTQSEAK